MISCAVRVTTVAIATVVVGAAAGCDNDSAPTPSAADCVNVVDESGQKTDECLSLAPESERVDLVSPTFSKPTPITNPLHPTTDVTQVIMGGQVDGRPFRTEVTVLPGTKPIPWQGTTVDTAVVQYVAYSDGRIHEVALDWYAQADDGSVWYFGEDVSNFEDGKVADTNGTWIADDTTPAAMIMPASPGVGDVYRPENSPGIVFEQVRVEKVDQTVAGPTGDLNGAIEVMELHMDGTSEGKVFAPGYGEFSTGNPGGDLEVVSLASPIDSRQGPAPAEFSALSAAAGSVFEASAAADTERMTRASAALKAAWDALLPMRIPPSMQTQMSADVESLMSATAAGDWPSAQSAALRIAQNETDLRLLYDRVIDVDLARVALWARQLPVDLGARDSGSVLADVAALERIWERTRPGVKATGAMDARMRELRLSADVEDLTAVDRAAAALVQDIASLRTR